MENTGQWKSWRNPTAIPSVPLKRFWHNKEIQTWKIRPRILQSIFLVLFHITQIKHDQKTAYLEGIFRNCNDIRVKQIPVVFAKIKNTVRVKTSLMGWRSDIISPSYVGQKSPTKCFEMHNIHKLWLRIETTWIAFAMIFKRFCNNLRRSGPICHYKETIWMLLD